MKTYLSSIIVGFFATGAAAFAFPDSSDPDFKKLLDTQDETLFTGRFAALLLELPPGDLPEFRVSLSDGFAEKKLPRRHLWQAITLTDKRWAEIDPTGFLIGCKKNFRELPATGPLRAAVILLDTDMEAALRVPQEFKLDAKQIMPLFAAELAARDPQKALSLFKERADDTKTFFTADSLLARWAETDPQAAWDSIADLPDSPDGQNRTRSYRKAVGTAAARRDPVVALGLIGSLQAAKEQAQAMRDLISALVADDIPLALELCRKVNTAEAWLGFAENLRAESDEETIRVLLDSLPPEHLEASLSAFFIFKGDPIGPAFRNSRMLPLLRDPALQKKMIIALIGAKIAETYSPMPAAVTDAALGMTTEILSERTPKHVQEQILPYMLLRDPMVLLERLLTIRQSDWRISEDAIVSYWPEDRYAEDVPVLLGHSNPIAKRISIGLIGKWLKDSPAAAFPFAARHAPERIAGDLRFEALSRELGGDIGKVRELLEAIADQKAKDAAILEFTEWSIGVLPADQVMGAIRKAVGSVKGRQLEGILSVLARREEAAFDNALAEIEGLTQKERDAFRSVRAGHLIRGDEELRALKVLASIESHDALFSCLYYLQFDAKVVTRWDSFLSVVAARPGAEKKDDVIRRYADMLFKEQGAAAPRIARKISNKGFREAFLAALGERMPLTAEDATWGNAIKLGLNTPEGRRCGIEAITRMAKDDPTAALTAIIRGGEAALHRDFLQPFMQQVFATDPAAAFAMARKLPERQAAEQLPEILRLWSAIDIRAACEAGLTLAGTDAYAYGVRYNIDSWFRSAPDAAREWVLSLPPGESRKLAMTCMIEHLATEKPEQAAEFLTAELAIPLPVSTVTRIAQGYASFSYFKSCQFLLGLEGRIEAELIVSPWHTILGEWFDSDPASAKEFLDQLPKSPFTKALLTALSTHPQFQGHLAALDISIPEGGELTQLLRSGALRQKVLSPEELAALRKGIIGASPAPSRYDLSAFCEYLIRHHMQGEIPALLEAVERKAMPTSAGASQAITQAIGDSAKYLCSNHPQRIPRFLDSLAGNPGWLETAVASLLYTGAGNERITPQNAAALLRIPPEKRQLLLARSIPPDWELPPELISGLTQTDASKPDEDSLAELIRAITRDELPQALAAAARLPADTGDCLVVAILTSLGSREKADEAILSIEDAEGRKRAEAWLNALPKFP